MCLPFRYEPSKHLPVQSQQLEQSLKYIYSYKDARTTPLTTLILNIVNINVLNIEQLLHIILVLKLLTLNR